MYNFNYGKIFAVGMAIIPSSLNIGFTVAQTVELKSFSPHLISLAFPSSSPKETTKNPDNTAAGGTRRIGRIDRCVEQSKSLTALTPNQSNYAKTISSQPTFFLYVPETTAESAEFILVDEEGKEIDNQKIPLSNKEGIIKITVSPEKKLEIGQKYQWEFLLKCNSLKISQIGTIERVELKPEIKSQLLTTTDPLEKARIYAKEFIWQETLTSLTSVRDSQPEEWNELLQSVGLEDFQNVPFLDCCQPKN
jgi:hypothetical protein